MTKETLSLLQDRFREASHPDSRILRCVNPTFMKGHNEKYMKMYNWMSYGYDFVETAVGKLKYGNRINEMRQHIMHQLEWREKANVLYVSIGTGKNLKFIPSTINKATLNIVGVDISLGMLKKCDKKFRNKLNLSLVNCCAEELPFKDNSFEIVFHVGGINFFTDRAMAIQEMVRVAKPGTKILVADETNDLIESQYKKSTFSKRYFQNTSVDVSEIEALTPTKERHTEIFWDGRFYCITFRK